MNSQSIECECGCWNIVVKVVPPGEPCPYCGSSEPHDCCPEKAKALGLPMPEEETCKAADPGGKGGYNVFQFERCKDCGKLHLASGVCPRKGVRPAKRFVCGAHQGGGSRHFSKGSAANMLGNQACHPRGGGGWACKPPPPPPPPPPRGCGIPPPCPSRRQGFTTTYCAANR